MGVTTTDLYENLAASNDYVFRNGQLQKNLVTVGVESSKTKDFMPKF
jgi:hypothetical protein